MPEALVAPRPLPPQGLELSVWIPANRSSSIVGLSLGAHANLGHRAEARCTRWGRSLAGEVILAIEVTVTSPPGVLPPLSREVSSDPRGRLSSSRAGGVDSGRCQAPTSAPSSSKPAPRS